MTNEPAVSRRPLLTAQQRKVAELACDPWVTRAEIAASLWLSPNTVKTHLQRIYRALNIHRRRDLAEALRALDGGT